MPAAYLIPPKDLVLGVLKIACEVKRMLQRIGFIAVVLALAASVCAQTLDGVFLGRNATTGSSFSDKVTVSIGDQVQVQWSFPNGVVCTGSWTNLQLPCAGTATFPAPNQSTQITMTVTAPGITAVTKSIQISPQGASAKPQFSFSGLRNAFSFENGPMAPNTIMTMFGTNLGVGESAALTNTAPLTLGATQLAVNGISVPLVYAAPGQINFLAPALVPGQQATLIVYNNGVASDPVVVPVHGYLPGLVSQAGVVQPFDASTFLPVTPDVALPAGKTIYLALYGTGFGSVVNGKLPGNLSVMVDDQISSIQYSGPAPGLVNMIQINIPVNLSIGAHSVVVFYEGRRVGAFSLTAK